MKKLENIIQKVFGKKYYLNVLNDHQQDYIASTPFQTLKAAQKHRDKLRENRTIHFVATISFRTKIPLDTIENKINA